MSHSELNEAIHQALSRVHATRETLALRHGEAEARLAAYESELAEGGASWLVNDDGHRFQGASRRALG